MTGAVVIGVGNPYRRDDGAGLAVVDALAGRVPDGVEVATCDQEPSRLIDAWEGASTAIVVDAAASGGVAGTVHRYEAGEAEIPAGVFRSSTHAFGVGDAVEIARALGSLPPRVVVYGIEGGDFDAGAGLTAPVAAAVAHVVESVLADLEEEPCTSAR